VVLVLAMVTAVMAPRVGGRALAGAGLVSMLELTQMPSVVVVHSVASMPALR
jgi:hypothetical protein